MQAIARDDNMLLTPRGEIAGVKSMRGEAQVSGCKGFPLARQALENQTRFREELEQLAPRLLPLAEGSRRSELKLVVLLRLAGSIQFRERSIRNPCQRSVLFW